MLIYQRFAEMYIAINYSADWVEIMYSPVIVKNQFESSLQTVNVTRFVIASS